MCQCAPKTRAEGNRREVLRKPPFSPKLSVDEPKQTRFRIPAEWRESSGTRRGTLLGRGRPPNQRDGKSDEWCCGTGGAAEGRRGGVLSRPPLRRNCWSGSSGEVPCATTAAAEGPTQGKAIRSRPRPQPMAARHVARRTASEGWTGAALICISQILMVLVTPEQMRVRP